MSLLDAKGHAGRRPARVHPPAGLADRTDRAGGAQRLIASSAVAGHYERAIDRESAYEKLKGRTESRQAEAPVKAGGTSARPARPRVRAPAAC